ncbi:SWF or SNF family helicase [Streptomyces sp. NPDC006739]|uniref:SWIM zinc finger family protein n=1 Tax=Streptomyces sp. NPDC006739 TaxID=3364763 RepID=UPI0036AA4F2D
MSGYDPRHDRGPERTFDASPPARGQGFARTWWGRSWLRALEEGALDTTPVKAGRKLARAGAVGAVTVRPGRVTAVVRDPGGAQHRADVLVPELSQDQWVRFLDFALERAGHLAALLDRELPPHLVEDAAAAGIGLLPGLGDLEPECDCGTWDHCGHTAALCHQVARLLDEDPFVLLLMRGRGRGAFLAELDLRGTTPPRTPDTVEGVDTQEGQEAVGAAGVDAAQAWAAAGITPPLPEPPGLPAAPGPPPSLAAETEPAPGIDPKALAHLAARTAAEAHRLLARALRPGGEGVLPLRELTVGEDAVRLADGAPPGTVTDRLAEGSGRGREGLAVAVRAWRTGGTEALSVLDGEWRVEGAALARARASLAAAWDEDERPSFRSSGNRWTVVDEPVQLRLGRDGRWWPYRDEGSRWVPAGDADRDPATALESARPGSESS